MTETTKPVKHSVLEDIIHTSMDYLNKTSRSEADIIAEEDRDRTEFRHLVSLLEAEPGFVNERSSSIGLSPVTKSPVHVTEKATITGVVFHRHDLTAVIKYHFPEEATQETEVLTLSAVTHELLLHESRFEGDIPLRQEEIHVKLLHSSSTLIFS